MSYLSKLYPGRKGSKGHAVFNALTDAAVIPAMAYGFGYVENRYRERASVQGVPVSAVAGAAGVAINLAASLFGVRQLRGVAGIAGEIGTAGLASYFHTLGAGKGADHSGVKRVLVDGKDMNKLKSVLPQSTVLGEIPKAPVGDFLSSSELAHLARRPA